jgi:hypothetical protein
VDLFSIQCTTCRARLKVKDESVIGDILACPKCGSMVQVVPPVGWSRSTVIAAVLGADAPREAVACWPPAGSTVQPAVTQPAVTVPPALPPRSVSPPPVKVAETAEANAAAVAAPTPPPIAAPPNPAPMAAAVQVASPLRAALAARIRADWMLYGGGLAVGALLGAGVWLFAAAQNSAPNAVAMDTTGEAALSRAPRASARRATEAAVSPTVELPIQASGPAAEPTLASQQKLPLEATPTAVERPAEKTAPETTLETPRPVAETANAHEPAKAVATGGVPAKAPSPAIKLEAIEKPLAKAESDPPNAKDAIAAPSAADEAPPARPLARTSPATGDSAGSPSQLSLSKAQIEERLAITLPTVAFVKVPLAQFVDFIGDFTALSISIDELALAKVGKKRQTPVTVQLSDATAREALDAAVGPLGLTCVVRGSRLVVTAGGDGAAPK